MNLVFICAPYRGRDEAAVTLNIARAKAIAMSVVNAAPHCFPITPHLNTGLFDFDSRTKHITDEYWLQGIRDLMVRCDMIYCPFTETTSGMTAELMLATERGIPVFSELEDVFKWHNTELETSNNWFIKFPSSEEMYQAFKARLKAEL